MVCGSWNECYPDRIDRAVFRVVFLCTLEQILPVFSIRKKSGALRITQNILDSIIFNVMTAAVLRRGSFASSFLTAYH